MVFYVIVVTLVMTFIMNNCCHGFTSVVMDD